LARNITIKLDLQPHLHIVATLPCEMQKS